MTTPREATAHHTAIRQAAGMLLDRGSVADSVTGSGYCNTLDKRTAATRPVPAPPPRTDSLAASAAATPVPLSAWRPRILEACGRHTPDVLAVAHLLCDEGPATIQQIAVAFGRERKWVMRTVASGREIGLFTLRSVGARNLHTYAVVTTNSTLERRF